MQNQKLADLTVLEEDLRAALHWEPSSSAAARMDHAVADAIAADDLALAWRWPRRTLVLVLAGALVLMGAAAAITLVQRAADMTSASRIAYERGERLNLSQTVDGYTVTLERGYVDPNLLMLAFQVDGPDGSSVAVPRAEVTDAAGRWYLEIGGGEVQADAQNAAGSISLFQVPPNTGDEVVLTATVDSLLPIADVGDPVGPWIFQFRLPVHPVTVVEPQRTIHAEGVPITLSRVQITATTVRIQLDTDVSALLDEQWLHWSMDATLRRDDGTEQDLWWSALPSEWTGQSFDEIEPILERTAQGWVMVRQTFAGTDNPSGHWTLTIERLNGFGDARGDTTSRRSIEGPWVLTFDVP